MTGPIGYWSEVVTSLTTLAGREPPREFPRGADVRGWAHFDNLVEVMSVSTRGARNRVNKNRYLTLWVSLNIMFQGGVSWSAWGPDVAETGRGRGERDLGASPQ